MLLSGLGSAHVCSFCCTAREGLGIDVLQTSQFPTKTLLFMSVSVKNCMQLFTVENSQMTADEIRAFVSLSCEKHVEQRRPGCMEQLHGHQDQGSVSAVSFEPMASIRGPLYSKMVAKSPALTSVLHATKGQKGPLSQLNDLPFKELYRKST